MYLLVTGFYAFLSHLDYLYAAVAAYLCGCFNGALFTSRLFFHDDVRTPGSGNAVAAVSLAAWLGARFDPRMLPDLPLTAAEQAEYVLHFKYWAGFFCVVGHMFPCTAKFRGGKGILCSATLTLLLDWRIALVCWSLFAVLWLTTRYVSLGSVSAAAVFPVMTHVVFGDAFATAFSVLIAALVLFAHRENIKRLLNGTENKFRFHVNAPKSEGEA